MDLVKNAKELEPPAPDPPALPSAPDPAAMHFTNAQFQAPMETARNDL